MTADMPRASRSACTAALFAPARSQAPMRRAIVDVTPAPSPLPSPIRTMKSGVMNPIAAMASAPRPATQIALTTL